MLEHFGNTWHITICTVVLNESEILEISMVNSLRIIEHGRTRLAGQVESRLPRAFCGLLS